jgi:RNA polymerase sigma factor (sigma-70 family)
LLELVATPPPCRARERADPAAALAGEPEAVARLVARHDAGLRALTRFYRLDRWDAEDVIQTTWLQFLLHGRRVRDPAAVRAWLMTTARRQCLRALQRHVRERPDTEPGPERPGFAADPEAELLGIEQRTVLARALGELPARQRDLMLLLVSEPDLSYDEVGRRLGMPVGSIGPVRARSLARLRRQGAVLALHAAGGQ